MLEMLDVMEEMAKKFTAMESDMKDLDEYVESIDNDLGDMEEALYADEDEDDEETPCEDDDCEDCDEDELDADQELSFDCPNCGKTLMIKASDIDFDQSPVCPNCNKPFFPDHIDGEDDDQ
ncbi:MAG: hypothetical protein PHY12_15440 [Eubacteriales bacterium]|nr:hypothetical protein [Eubacteriales bacterium]